MLKENILKINQKGFSVIEGLIILVVVGAIGFAGWYVYDSRKSEDKKDTSTSKAQKNDEAHEEEDDEAVETRTELTSYNKKFSIFLPDGWTVTNDTELDYVMAIGLENITYKAGEPAKIVNERAHRGGGITTSHFMMQYGNASDQENYFSAFEEQGTFKTASGLEGKKYLFAPTQSNEETGAVAGSKVYGYKFTNGDKATVISYTKLEADPDQLHVVEDSVKTFKFL